MEQTKLALRVFKRSNQHLLLLWRKNQDTDPLQTEIKFSSVRSGGTPVFLKQGDFVIDEPTIGREAGLSNMNISEDTVICLIREKNVGLSPADPYYVRVKYGEIEESIRLVPAGTFPSHEQEDKKKNTHLLGWNPERSDWRKLTAVKGARGQYFLGVVLVDSVSGQPVDLATMKPLNTSDKYGED